MIKPISISSSLAATPQKSPQYGVSVKLKNGEELKACDPKATRALVSLMDMEAVLYGAASHYGGPAAFAELMSAVHAYMFHQSQKNNVPWYELFNFVNDAGHCENGLYALKANYQFGDLTLNDLKKFRSIQSFLCGHGESHLYPQGVLLSNGPLGSAFPQSEGLALADHLTQKNRITVTAISDGAMMEGEAREALSSIPGLASKKQLAPYVLIISDNNTKLSGRIDADCFSMQPTFNSMKALGWDVIELSDGHDLQKCLDAFVEACHRAQANPTKPVAIHAKTIKGIGTKKTADSSSGAHGFPLKSPTELKNFLQEIYGEQNVPSEFQKWTEDLIELEAKIKAQPKSGGASDEKIQTGISLAMTNAFKAGHPVVSVTSDLPGSTGVAGFRKEFPQASIDIGVAESNMVSAAVGLSKLGYIPVVDTFAQFGVTKGALPLMMANLSEAPMICVFSHTGFQDAADGASHQALCYLAMTGGIPHTEVYSLTSSEEAYQLMSQAIETFTQERKQGKTPKTYIFFLGRENFPKTFKDGLNYQLGQGQIISDRTHGFSKAVTLVGVGSMLGEALKAQSILEKSGVGSVVVNPAVINHPDVSLFTKVLSKTSGHLVVVDDHQKIGGAASFLTQALSEAGVHHKLAVCAVNGEYGRSAYNAIDLYKLHGLDSESIAKKALSFFA